MRDSAALAKSTWFRCVEDLSNHKHQGAAWASGPLVRSCCWKTSRKLPGFVGSLPRNLPAQPWHILFRRVPHCALLRTCFIIVVHKLSESFQEFSRSFQGSCHIHFDSICGFPFLGFKKVSRKASGKFLGASGDAVKVNVFTPQKIAG